MFASRLGPRLIRLVHTLSNLVDLHTLDEGDCAVLNFTLTLQCVSRNRTLIIPIPFSSSSSSHNPTTELSSTLFKIYPNANPIPNLNRISDQNSIPNTSEDQNFLLESRVNVSIRCVELLIHIGLVRIYVDTRYIWPSL